MNWPDSPGRARAAAARTSVSAARACEGIAAFWSRLGRASASVALGLSSGQALATISTRTWSGSGSHQDAGRLTCGLFPWERCLYQPWVPPRGTICLIGCGDGRDLLAFAKLGYVVEGVDISSQLIAAARALLAEAGVDAPLHCADACGLALPERRFDAVIFSNFTYSLIPRARRRIDALRSLRASLARGGRVILTYNINPALGHPRGLRLARWLAHAAGNPDPPEAGDVLTTAGMYFHVFTDREIRCEAGAAGYSIEVLSAVTGRDSHDCAALLMPTAQDSSPAA